MKRCFGSILSFLFFVEALNGASSTEVRIHFQEVSEEKPPVFTVLVERGEANSLEFGIALDNTFSEEWEKVIAQVCQAVKMENETYMLAFNLEGSLEAVQALPFLEEQVMDLLSQLPFISSSVDSRIASIYSPFAVPALQGWGDSDEDADSPKSPAAKPFFDLPIAIEDKINIRQLMSSMADKNLVQLFLDKKSMEKLGDKIRRVHPLRFMGFILSDSSLKKYLTVIANDSIKWDNFIGGFEERMKKEAKAGNLDVYGPGFAELLQTDSNLVQDYLKKKNYVGLVKKLMYN
jgi:hypothetical protein